MRKANEGEPMNPEYELSWDEEPPSGFLEVPEGYRPKRVRRSGARINTARRGYRAERASAHALQLEGYYCIFSRASKGVFDLVAIRETDTLLVQVKSGNWPDKKEWLRLEAFKAPPGTEKRLHIWTCGRLSSVRIPNPEVITCG